MQLSALGYHQARAIANRLRSEKFERIYSSDLTRARVTAETIAALHGLRVETDARLREFRFGEWEGLTWIEIEERNPRLRAATDIIAAYDPPGGETIADVIDRWKSFQADLAREGNQRVLVVTHAGMLHAVMRATKPRGAEEAFGGRFKFRPASLTRISFDREQGAFATALSDAEHLEEDSPHWMEAVSQTTKES